MINNQPIVPVGGVSLPLNCKWTFESDGTWICPKTGVYSLELHGAGGTGYGKKSGNRYYTKGGGGSGNLENAKLIAFVGYRIIIGTNSNDGATSLTSAEGTVYSIGKGGNANSDNVGSPTGNIASGGSHNMGTSVYYTAEGGEGNINNPSQSYGDGGVGRGANEATPGSSGGIIITYLGE